MSRWPRDNQDDLIAFYGMPGSAVESQLVDVVPPFRMTYEGKPIKSIKFHKKAAPALLAALTEIWEHYGKDQSKIDALGVSRYDGAYNPRFIRGSSSKWSNHAYGAAIDINAKDNGFNTGHGNMPQPVVDAFKRQGARWGGTYKNRTDPMHFEFCDNGEGDVVAPPKVDQPVVKPPVVTTDALRHRMAKTIIDFEARRDSHGHLAVYALPANDGGGTYEVAGINEKFNPTEAPKLRAMVEAGKYAEAETFAQDFILKDTDIAIQWTGDPGVEFYLRDCVFNRGAHGGARILQRAVGVHDDGVIGAETRAAMARIAPVELLSKLRGARESYERQVVGYRANFWNGLVNRWDKSYAAARVFQTEAVAIKGKAPTVVTTGLVAVGGFAWLAHSFGAHPALTVAVAAFAGVFVMIIVAAVIHPKPAA